VISDTFDGQTIFGKKKRLAIKNVRNAISDSFDGQTILGEKKRLAIKNVRNAISDTFDAQTIFLKIPQFTLFFPNLH